MQRQRNTTPLRGLGLELIAVSAVVLDGVKLTGGYGTVVGAASGLLLLGLLNQGLILMGAPLQVFWVLAGAFIIVSVILSNDIQAMYRGVEPKKIDPVL